MEEALLRSKFQQCARWRSRLSGWQHRPELCVTPPISSSNRYGLNETASPDRFATRSFQLFCNIAVYAFCGSTRNIVQAALLHDSARQTCCAGVAEEANVALDDGESTESASLAGHRRWKSLHLTILDKLRISTVALFYHL
jgi:hypothetical protein